jgi:hypothetical protein
MNTSLVRIGWLVLALASATTAQAQLAPPIDPNLSCSIPVVDVDDPVVVYGDQPGSGFSLNVWGEHASAPTVTDNPYQGTNALHMHFVELWDGIEFQSTTVYDSTTVGGIRVAVRGNQSGGNIRIYLLTDTWEKLGFDVPLFDYVVRGAVLEDWQVAYVPIADLIGAQSALIGGLGIQSEFAAELWIDDVQILPTEPVGLYTLFSDHLGDAELIQWGLSFSTDRDAFSGEQSIRALSAYGGSGLLFHLPEVMNSNSYGALTFAVKSDISNLVITPYLETPAGVVNTHLNVADYVHGGITDEWKVVWIPMRDLTGSMTAAIVNLYLEFNQPGVVWLDEVKVVEGLWFPLWDTTPYDASVSAVFDINRAGHGVQVYTGEVGNVQRGCYEYQSDGVTCKWWAKAWQKADGTAFDLPYLNYEDGMRGVEKGVDAVNTSLFYSNHEGYDYPMSKGTHIHAATSGILCFDSSGSLGGMKRDESKCSPARYTTTTLHPFVIAYENTLRTRYLHAEGDYYGLTKWVYDQLVAKGYAEVDRGDHVGYVGGATGYGHHLHLETELNGELVDPYRLRQTLPIGSGVLWTADPPQ